MECKYKNHNDNIFNLGECCFCGSKKYNTMLKTKEKLIKRLEKIEAELEKVRGCSPLTDGWQTMRFAKKDRKWDKLAEEKMLIKKKLDEEFGIE